MQACHDDAIFRAKTRAAEVVLLEAQPSLAGDGWALSYLQFIDTEIAEMFLAISGPAATVESRRCFSSGSGAQLEGRLHQCVTRLREIVSADASLRWKSHADEIAGRPRKPGHLRLDSKRRQEKYFLALLTRARTARNAWTYRETVEQRRKRSFHIASSRRRCTMPDERVKAGELVSYARLMRQELASPCRRRR